MIIKAPTKASVLLISLCLFASVILVFSNISVQSGEYYNWIVDDNGMADFQSIQTAIDAAVSGDIILVKGGTYSENITIDKVSLQVFGEKDTVIHGNVNISANDVSFVGFIIQALPQSYGIFLNSVDNCLIANNTISNMDVGISLYQESTKNNVKVANNNITGNCLYNNTVAVFSNTEFGSGSGTYITIDSYVTVYGNNFVGNLVANNSYGFLISHDIGISNYMTFYDGNFFSDNIVSNNNHGFYFNYTIGILDLFDTEWVVFGNNDIIGNNITRNNCAIEVYCENIGFLTTSENNSIIFGSNHIFNNNFVENVKVRSSGGIHIGTWIAETIDIILTSAYDQWDNGLPSGGNYWSDYLGSDTNSDGIGDAPYIINSENIDRYPLMTAVLIGTPEIPETPKYPMPSPTPSPSPTPTPLPTTTPTPSPNPTPSPQPSATPSPTTASSPEPTLTPEIPEFPSILFLLIFMITIIVGSLISNRYPKQKGQDRFTIIGS